jgi:hypothetical protein
VTEAEACRDSLRLALVIGETGRVLMESDSLQLVSLWKTNLGQGQQSEVAVILAEMQEMVSSPASFGVARPTLLLIFVPTHVTLSTR